MQPSVVAYLVVMSAVTLGTRILPLTLIRKPITNRFFRSFLYYVPYVTLAVMTFPAILARRGRGGALCGHRGRVAWGEPPAGGCWMLRRGVRAGAAAGVGRRVSARGAKLPATLPPLVASSPRGNCWPLRGCGVKSQRFPGNERRYVSENCPVVRETPSPLRQLCQSWSATPAAWATHMWPFWSGVRAWRFARANRRY